MAETNTDNEQYRIILDSIADGVFTVDSEWNVTSFNKAAERITGVSSKDAIGKKCWEVFHADICEGKCSLRETIRTATPSLNLTVRIVTSSGKRVPVSISTALLRDSEGKVVGGVETFRDLSRIEELRKELRTSRTYHDIVTADHRILKMFDILPAVASADTPVLVLGESGTGKELLARAIHELSPRANGPFVAVNCGALPDNLLESELFGYRKGAFTDAKTDKPGRFDRAQGGTLFLDEIGDLSKPLQVKLLRVIQDKHYEPLGATEPVKADTRIITATNHDLGDLVQKGVFRKDLYYRINVLSFTLPPLRKRRGDIPLLVEHFIDHFNRVYGREINDISPEALAALAGYDYPGNIRELENVLQHAFVLSSSNRIELRDLPETVTSHPTPPAGETSPGSYEEFETSRIKAALEANRFNRTLTARQLGMHPTTLWRKMKKLGIE